MTASTRQPRNLRSRIAGMSLVEILAAMLVGLIGMTIIMQVFSVSEGRKRATTGTGDAQITGNLATFTLEHELRNAGFGMILSPTNNMLGCNTKAYDSKRTTPDFNFTMAPLVITDGATGAPDSIQVIYGNSPSAVSGSKFASPATADANFPLENAAGFRVGDLAVASDNVAGVDCALVEVTGFTVGAVNNVEHVSGAVYSYTDVYGFTINSVATLNKGGGLSVGGDYTDDALLFSLGRSPTVKTFVIKDGKLQTDTLVPYDPSLDSDNDDLSEAEIADGVVQLQAEYGKDTNADDIVDLWDTVTPATAANWMQVQAVRFAIVVRSQQFEREPVSIYASCATTIAADPADCRRPFWIGGDFDMFNLDGTADSKPGGANDWRHYRYRVYQTVVPLRNMIWGNAA